VPPRHAYWTILYGNRPTSFRAATRDELLPTLRQLQSKHPDAVLMWFARGRLWASPEQARETLMRRQRPTDRARSWRPGGAHRDPRERFKVSRDVKRKRFAARMRRTGTRPTTRRKKDDSE
jgi:hypothetical protein